MNCFLSKDDPGVISGICSSGIALGIKIARALRVIRPHNAVIVFSEEALNVSAVITPVILPNCQPFSFNVVGQPCPLRRRHARSGLRSTPPAEGSYPAVSGCLGEVWTVSSGRSAAGGKKKQLVLIKHQLGQSRSPRRFI